MSNKRYFLNSLTYNKIVLLFLISILVILLIFGKYDDKTFFIHIISKTNETTKFECKEHRLPDAIIFGTAKAGTGALMVFLRLNSKIVTPNTEMHFFNRNYKQGLEEYRRKLPSVKRDQVG